MATYDWTGKAKVPSATSSDGVASTQTGTVIDNGDNSMVVYSVYIDTSTYGMTNGDVHQIFKVPAGFVPVDFFLYVATAEGDATTLSVGDGTDSGRFSDTDLDLNSATTQRLSFDGEFTFTAADTIDIGVSAAAGTAKFTLSMIGFQSKIS